MRSDRSRLLTDAQRRTTTSVRRMAGGSLDGRIDQAAPMPERSVGAAYTARTVPILTTTVVVAGYETSPAGKAGADFVCDGSGDHVEIQQALDYIDTLPSGYTGEILFLEGRYNLGDRIYGPSTVEVQLRGLGGRQSIIVGYGFTDLEYAFTRATALGWRNCTNALDLGSACETEMSVDHCNFEDCNGAIRTYLGPGTPSWFVNSNVSIHDNHFFDCTGNVIDMGRRTLGMAIHHNVMNNGFATYGIKVNSLDTDAHSDVSIIGNQQAFADAVLVQHCDTVTFIGNSGAGLAFTDVDYFTLAGNIFSTYTETTCTNRSAVVGANIGTGFP